jgi:hypothetical protein
MESMSDCCFFVTLEVFLVSKISRTVEEKIRYDQRKRGRLT